jgi:NADPH-dependent 2,4-dienoyl-CoA reductase/sulfur reductase-like enzyme/peroxiredoxin family protein/rhodanese-related sulfurtransferase/TusA-related sulfurtransferase
MKVIVIGGVAGGASTVARLRRLTEDAEIILFERGEEISYANCGIPYHIGDVIKDRDQLVVISKEEFEKQFKIDIRIRSEVLSIDQENKTVKVKDANNGNEYEESYNKLVLSPGGYPVRPPLPGINSSKIFSIRNLQDMDNIKSFIQEKGPKKAVVVGAGFIGLEVAENLKELGMSVSIVELADQVMNLMDYEMATAIHQHLHSKNVELYLKDGVKEFKEKGGSLELELQSGRKLEAELVVLSIGIKPEVKLAKDAGLEIGQLGGIKVSDKMETSCQDIYALGDVIEVKDSVSGQPSLIPLANSANKQGRIVADNIMGAAKKYPGTPATAIAKVFDLAVAITGNNEKQLKKRGLSFSKAFLNPSSHAGYYPGAFPLIFKLIYSEPEGKILGAQVIGAEGVDKRIDVVAAMIQSGKTIYDLAALELAYAPPFSSAKDPVNLAGMIAINQLEGKNPVIFWDELDALKKEGVKLIDVRSPLEFELAHIEGATNIPLDDIRERLTEIPKDKKVVLYCNQGKKTYFAISILKNLGFRNVLNLSGGYKLYKFTTLKQENVGIFEDSFIDKKDDLHPVVKKEGSVIELDACGLQCPGPIMKLAQTAQLAKNGDVIRIQVTDPGFKSDIGVWCDKTGSTLLSVEDRDKKVIAHIQKGEPEVKSGRIGDIPHDKTIVVFSNDLDRALASFIIANGAAAMGRKVTMFFTFWGLNVLRSSEKVKVKKGLIDKMFGMMMPRGSKKLILSKMNMMGMGSMMMKQVMKAKNVDALEIMVQEALASGVRMVACQMSMDIMGIKKEELIKGVELGGVAAYLGAAEDADTNLFI